MIYYLILIFCFGFSLSIVLDKLNIVSIKKLNIFEYLAYFPTLGFFGLSIYMFIYGALKIKYTNSMFICVAIFSIIISLYYLITKKINLNIHIDLNIIKKNYMTIITIILLTLNIIYLISYSTSNNLMFPDEFSVWALNAKNIFLGKKMTFFINTGLEIYPNFLPLLYSGFYIFIDKISESNIRVIPVIFYLLLTFGMIGLGKKHNIKIWKIILANLFILNSYTGFVSIVASAYGDIPFACGYTIGMLYFFEWLIFDEKKENMFLSILFLNTACWTKTDGLLMILPFNAFVIILYILFKKRIKIPTNYSIKKLILFLLSSVSIGIIWKGYTIVNSFPTNLSAGAGSTFKLEISYLEPLLRNMTSQQFSTWPWILFLVSCIVLFLKKFDKMKATSKVYFILLILTVLFTMVFMFACYLFIFGGEALIAASYVRYLTRAIFIMAFAVLYILEGDIIK